MIGRKDGHQTAARKSARAGGFDSRSLAEIVVKDGVRIPDCGANHLASALGVESGLTAGKDRHQQLLIENAKDSRMLTLTLSRFSHCRLWPAWASNAAGWQIHWLWIYFEWRNKQ